MGEKLVLLLLALAVGLIIGMFTPVFGSVSHQVDLLVNPPTPGPTATVFSLSVTRPTVAQTAVPPTLRPATPVPEPTPGPTPVVRSFTIPLKGGGEMTVNATDHAAAINNVKSTGAVPAE